MTKSDAVHVFDRSAGNVISISSYIETVGLFSNQPLSKGLLGPSEDDGVLTCVDSLLICGLCWNPPLLPQASPGVHGCDQDVFRQPFHHEVVFPLQVSGHGGFRL